MSPIRIVRKNDAAGRRHPNTLRVELASNQYFLQSRRIWRPPTDVFETARHIVIKVEVAGMAEDDFEVTATGHQVIITGVRRDPGGELAYQNMEIRYGEFRTEVWVGWPLDRASIEATYENGFLFIKLPKSEQRRVLVRVQSVGDSIEDTGDSKIGD